MVTITAIMAAGKSTVASLLAERFPRSGHIRGGLFRRAIVNGRAAIRPGPAGEGRSELELRHRLAAMAADAYAAAGFVVVVQDVILESLLSRDVEQVQSRPHYLVMLAPRPEVVAIRERGRPKRGYVDGWTVAGLDRAFREETPRLGLLLDTSDQSPEETVDAILARFRSEARL